MVYYNPQWLEKILLADYQSRNPTLIPNKETYFFPQKLVPPAKEGEISKIRFPAPTRLKVGNYPHVNLFILLQIVRNL